MNNVEKCIELGIIDDVRQTMGAENGDDISQDDNINELTNDELVGKYCGWILGSEQWWSDLKQTFDELESLDVIHNPKVN